MMWLQLLLAQSECLLHSGRPGALSTGLDIAQKGLQFAVANELDVGTCHCQIGRGLWAQAKLQQAEDAFRKATKQCGSANSLIHLVYLLEFRGQSREARDLLQAAVKNHM